MRWFDLRCVHEPSTCGHDGCSLETSNKYQNIKRRISTENTENEGRGNSNNNNNNGSTNCVQCKYDENDHFSQYLTPFKLLCIIIICQTSLFKMRILRSRLRFILYRRLWLGTPYAHKKISAIKKTHPHIKWLPYYDHRWIHMEMCFLFVCTESESVFGFVHLFRFQSVHQTLHVLVKAYSFKHHSFSSNEWLLTFSARLFYNDCRHPIGRSFLRSLFLSHYTNGVRACAVCRLYSLKVHFTTLALNIGGTTESTLKSSQTLTKQSKSSHTKNGIARMNELSLNKPANATMARFYDFT